VSNIAHLQEIVMNLDLQDGSTVVVGIDPSWIPEYIRASNEHYPEEGPTFEGFRNWVIAHFQGDFTPENEFILEFPHSRC
jgi:hypothetical protein